MLCLLWGLSSSCARQTDRIVWRKELVILQSNSSWFKMCQTKQHTARSSHFLFLTQFRKKRGAETQNILLVISKKMYKFSSAPRRANRISSSFHYSLCFTSGHFQASTGPAASLVPVQHHLGPSSEAGLVLRRLDEICMDTEGNWGGGRKTQVPFILVGFPWSPQFCSSLPRTVLSSAVQDNELQNWGLFPPYVPLYINVST